MPPSPSQAWPDRWPPRAAPSPTGSRQLYRRDGLWVSHQHSVTRPGSAGLAEIAAAMTVLETRVPEQLAGQQVLASVDYRVGADQRPPWLEAHDMVALELTDGRALIRPSGTEPKLKIYVDLRGDGRPRPRPRRPVGRAAARVPPRSRRTSPLS